MNNPIEIIKAIKNPQKFVMDYVANNSDNPMLNNLVKEAQKGNNKALETFANNMLKEKGLNLEDIMNNFQ